MTNEPITISYSQTIRTGINNFKDCAKKWKDDYDVPYPERDDHQGWVEYAVQVIGNTCSSIPKNTLEKKLPK